MRPALQYFIFFGLFCYFLILGNISSFAQSETKDLKDVFKEWKDDTLSINEHKLKVGKTYFSILPVIGYGPANGFVAGGAVSFAKLFGEPPTNLSSAMLNFTITSKSQFILNARSKIYLKENKWFMQGDWRFLVFTQPTYGLGIEFLDINELLFHVNNLDESSEPYGEPMKFNQIRVYEEVVYKIGSSDIYAGMGIALDYHFDIVDELLDTVKNSPEFYVTKHFLYSYMNNFSPTQYSNQGLKFTVLTDTRDNISNCYKGYYASFSILQNFKLGENSRNSTQLLYDARYYLGMNALRPRHVLAFWSWGNILLTGTPPYLALPSIGWDTYNRSGRGYIQGRYRGSSMVYNEVEYRFPISKSGLFGGTLFANVTTASSYTQKLFDYATLGIGAGLRLQLDKLARTNLTIDFGMGTDHSSGIYFNLQETF
ncbi:MAG: BamA/TamA family outer membrane protein [Lentimicrobium sp.]|nr:BamA/TamA family outer membrane protein [Lentimicrobium sp.]